MLLIDFNNIAFICSDESVDGLYSVDMGSSDVNHAADVSDLFARMYQMCLPFDWYIYKHMIWVIIRRLYWLGVYDFLH